MRFSRIIIVLLVLLALLQAVHYGPLLPERIASHFGAAGQADGWSSRNSFLATNLVMVAVMALLFGVLPALLSRIPDASINLPHKDYWLAPGRRAATFDLLSRQMEWLGAATLALLAGITQLSIRANLASSTRLPSDLFWLLFGAYMAFVVAWTVLLLRRWHARPPRREDLA